MSHRNAGTNRREASLQCARDSEMRRLEGLPRPWLAGFRCPLISCRGESQCRRHESGRQARLVGRQCRPERSPHLRWQLPGSHEPVPHAPLRKIHQLLAGTEKIYPDYPEPRQGSFSNTTRSNVAPRTARERLFTRCKRTCYGSWVRLDPGCIAGFVTSWDHAQTPPAYSAGAAALTDMSLTEKR
jgi:hypothetical protein